MKPYYGAEAADRIGGHVHTVPVEIDGQIHGIDTGFIVYNERTYPRFSRLLQSLNLSHRPNPAP